MLSTAQKMGLAKAASMAVLAARGLLRLSPVTRARRGGLAWELDLREGIDLSIYLLGGFEKRTLRAYRRLVKPGAVVLDIGANVGSHTLPLAVLVGAAGKVIAYEPTQYAIEKLKVNLSLNQAIAARVAAHQVMLVESGQVPVEDALYSSWPLGAEDTVHPKHRGRLMSTAGATSMTLDAAVRSAGVERVDFIKLDVDGHELSVLKGGLESMRRDRPEIMLELAPYAHDGAQDQFEELLDFLRGNRYALSDPASGRRLPEDPDALRAGIPREGGINVLASGA